MYNVSLFLKTNSVLLLLLFYINVKSEEYYDDYYDGSKFDVIDSYFGVTVIVYLLNSTILYCMGLLVNDVNNTNSEIDEDFQYVLTSAGCVVHDWLDEIRVCVKGNPYNDPNDENMREVVRFIVHPKYNEENHTGDIVLIRMDKIFRGKTYLMSDENPMIFYEKGIENKKIGIFLWSNGQEHLPKKLTKKDVILLQWQSIYYSMNTTRCPALSDMNKSNGTNEKIWYMFLCADYKTPTRNAIGNLGAQVFYNNSILGIYSYSVEMSLQTTDPNAPGYNKIPNLKKKSSQVHRYTLLYWYLPWIQYTIYTDKRRKGEELYYNGNETTKSVTPRHRLTTTTQKSETENYFDVEAAYDGVPLGANPCDGATSLFGHYPQSIMTLLNLISIVSYNIY